jgi:hypothetical protein
VSKFKVKVMLTVSLRVCLGVRHPPGAHDQIFIAVRQLQGCGTSPLWQEDRSVVYNCCCWASSAHHTSVSKSKWKFYYDPRSVGKSVLVLGTHLVLYSWPLCLLLSLILFRQLWICCCGAPLSDEKWGCSLQFLLGIASAAFLRPESQGTH